MKNIALLSGAAALVFLTGACQNRKDVRTPKYNIVYIMTDDHTAQMMSCYGSPYAETPNLVNWDLQKNWRRKWVHRIFM